MRRSSRVTKAPVWMDAYITKSFPKPTAMCATITSQPVESTFQSFLSSLTSAADPKSFQ